MRKQRGSFFYFSGPRGETSLINRKARWTLRFISGYIGRWFAKNAEGIGNHPVFCLFLSLSSVFIFRMGADPQKLPHSRNTRFPRGIGGRKLLITCGMSEKRKKNSGLYKNENLGRGAPFDQKYTFPLVAEATRSSTSKTSWTSKNSYRRRFAYI